MDKKILTQKMANWLDDFLHLKLSTTHEILEVITPDTSLSKLPNQYIKSCENSSAWDFTPDVLGILKNKKNDQIEFVLLNRSLNALSLKEIGEIRLYSKLINSRLSFLTSLNGVSNEVNILLLEDIIRTRLLNYEEDNEIIIFSWDEKQNTVNPNSVIPLNKKSFLLDL